MPSQLNLPSVRSFVTVNFFIFVFAYFSLFGLLSSMIKRILILTLFSALQNKQFIFAFVFPIWLTRIQCKITRFEEATLELCFLNDITFRTIGRSFFNSTTLILLREHWDQHVQFLVPFRTKIMNEIWY